MFSAKRYIIFLTFILFTFNLPAQNLTGTWEGDLGRDQFLQLNILQTGDKICGFTYDHLVLDTNSFCKAFFEGYFDKKNMQLIITGKYFIQTAPDHDLMYLRLDYTKFRKLEILEQLPFQYQPPPRVDAYIRGRQDMWNTYRNQQLEEEEDTILYVSLKKISNKPNEIKEIMEECMNNSKKRTDSLVAKKSPEPKKNIVTVIPKDSLPQVVIQPPVITDTIATLKPITQRKNIEQSYITTDVKTINLKVYDNAIIDGDTISILYNGKMLLTHQLLTEKGIELNIELDENQTRNELILFAENLGSIPPNTALIVVTAGKKRYELFASASLEANAVLVFEYKPK